MSNWARPTLPSRSYVSADAWTHYRDVHTLRFFSTTGRPALRVIMDASLEFGEAVALFGQVLDTFYGAEDDGGE